MPDPASTPRSPELCLNCEAPVVLEFCPACGQRRGDHRKPLWQLLGEVLQEALQLDGRLARTLRALLRPGRLTREFNEGRRQRYTSPVRLYLFASVMLFAALSIGFRAELALDPKLFDDAVVMEPAPEGSDERELQVGLDTIDFDDGTVLGRVIEGRATELRGMSQSELFKEVFSTALEQGPLVMVFMLPIFSVLLTVAFVGTGRMFVEHLVFSLHVHTAWFLLLLVWVVMPFDSGALLGLLFVLMWIYTTAALQHAYAARWWTTLLRAGVLTGAYILALVMVYATVALLALMLG